jgi:phage gp45-like
MAIGYVNTANTFQQWLIATQDLITVANNLTDNIAGTFYANTNLVAGNTLNVVGDTTISGNLTVSGNITLDALGFDDLAVNGSATIANTLVVTGNTTLSNVTISSNVSNINVTSTLAVGANANIYGTLYVAGDTTFGGNVILDSIGFDDLTVTGNTTVSGTLNVSGVSTLANANVAILSGTANTDIYNAISALEGTALAFSIALG